MRCTARVSVVLITVTGVLAWAIPPVNIAVAAVGMLICAWNVR